MAKQPARSELYELYAKIYRSTSAEKEYFLRALRLQLDQVKDKLVSVTDVNSMLRLQGEANALDKILAQMTSAPLTDQE